jgi:hypothetical protein
VYIFKSSENKKNIRNLKIEKPNIGGNLMRNKKIKTGEFKARTVDGKTVIIFEFTEYLDAGTFENPNKKIEGLKSYSTSDGNHVNSISKNKYEIVETGQIVSKYK